MEGLAPGTTKSCLAAVRYDQVARGFGNPTIGGMPLLEYVVRGLKRLTPEDEEIRASQARNLTSIESGVKKGTNRRNAKLNGLGSSMPLLFGFLRSGEAVALSERNNGPNHHLHFRDI